MQDISKELEATVNPAWIRPVSPSYRTAREIMRKGREREEWSACILLCVLQHTTRPQLSQRLTEQVRIISVLFLHRADSERTGEIHHFN